MLRNTEITAGELAERFDMSKPSMSHHFALLKEAELIFSRRDGQTIWYALNTSVVEDVLAWGAGSGARRECSASPSPLRQKGAAMKNRTLLLCIAIIVSMVVLTAFVVAGLPATVALHWNIDGAPDRFGPRAWLFGHLAINAAVLLLWVWLPTLSPRRFGVEGFMGTYWRIGLLVTLLLAAVHALVLWTALGHEVSASQALPAGAAIFIGLLCNVMGKVRRNFWIGIRTPWTLANERVWYATHRFAGKSMVAGAILSLAGLVAGGSRSLCLALLVGGVLAPALYSFWMQRRLERG